MLVIGGLAALASVPRSAWVALGALVLVVALVKVFWRAKPEHASATSVANDLAHAQAKVMRRAEPRVPPPPSPQTGAGRTVNDGIPLRAPPQPPRPPSPPARPAVDADTPISVVPAPPASREFRTPLAPRGFGVASWVPAHQSITVAGTTISDGMVYVGTSLPTPLGKNDPSLIDPSKHVAKRGDYTASQLGYWPSYSEMTAESRRAYLDWLAEGRRAPNADIGYVFVFFYGLERRAILDASKDAAAQSDWPIIANEVRRLLGIYGERSSSFRHYAGSLLDWVTAPDYPEKLYEQELPALTKSFEMPLYLRLALGQAALDGAPLPCRLALAWLRLDPNTSLRTPATRCEEQFERLFAQKYADTFGAGMVLPRNRTKLKVVHRPASSALHGYDELAMTFEDAPDVTVLTGPQKKLRKITDSVSDDLDAFSRFLGRNPGQETSLEAALLLPATLWPASIRAALDSIKARVENDVVTTTYGALTESLASTAVLNKERTLAFARALESIGVGFEPDVISGAKTPKADDPVVLFALRSGETHPRTAPQYQAAALTLQLASVIGFADGDFGDEETRHLRTQIQSWTHLNRGHRERLTAHVHLLKSSPVTLASLKRKLEPLDATTRDVVATFLASVAHADGSISAAEVKMLEKAYKALGVDPKRVFSDVHAGSSVTEATPGASPKVSKAGFTLDPTRIAALQQDTQRVSTLLADIFTEEAPEEVSAMAPIDADDELDVPTGVLGLDEAHSAFARAVLSRPEWSREELAELAADLDLMLDGALEQINDAAFEVHGVPMTEGDDPAKISSEILEKIDP